MTHCRNCEYPIHWTPDAGPYPSPEWVHENGHRRCPLNIGIARPGTDENLACVLSTARRRLLELCDGTAGTVALADDLHHLAESFGA